MHQGPLSCSLSDVTMPFVRRWLIGRGSGVGLCDYLSYLVRCPMAYKQMHSSNQEGCNACRCPKAKGSAAAEKVARQALGKEVPDAVTGYAALSTLSALGKKASASEIKNALVPLAKQQAGKAILFHYMYNSTVTQCHPQIHTIVTEEPGECSRCKLCCLSEGVKMLAWCDRGVSRRGARVRQASWPQPVAIWLELRRAAWAHWTRTVMQPWRRLSQGSLRHGIPSNIPLMYFHALSVHLPDDYGACIPLLSRAFWQTFS